MTDSGSASNLTRGTGIAQPLRYASSFWAKLAGLMGRPSLAPGTGLWLPGSNGIHMLFMRFPIDVVFVSRPDEAGDRRVLALRRALPPWRGVVWYVRGANGCLELPVGAIDASATAVGDRVAIRTADKLA